jgi:hypothetical protein
MRFFTRAWATGELSEEEWLRASEAYRARVAEIIPRLSPAMVRLAAELSLHDGLIARVVWNAHTHCLRLTLVCGDAQGGCVEVRLVYRGAMLGRSRLEALRRAALSRETELLYDEVDVDDDAILSHRLLFAPCEEVTIDFRELELIIAPRADRRVHLVGAFVEEGPEES